MVIPSLGLVVLASGVLVGVAPESEPTVLGSAAFLAVYFIVIIIVQFDALGPLLSEHPRTRYLPSNSTVRTNLECWLR